MDKEIITRTSGKKLGYINQVFIDPKRLEVVTLYLRQSVSSLGAVSVEHVSLSSLKQIGDVVLVHDESALWDPPGDETMGYVQMIGSEVQTEDGFSIGKIRDFLFNPDNGQILSIRFDALGIPSIPQNLLTCSRLNWRDIIAVGPTKTIVRRGADRGGGRGARGPAGRLPGQCSTANWISRPRRKVGSSASTCSIGWAGAPASPVPLVCCPVP